MCVATAIIVGVGVAGSVTAAKISSNASKSAAKTQVDAAGQALEGQQAQYAQSRADFNPYAQAGVAALGRLSAQSARPVQGFRQPAPPPQLGMPQSAPPGGRFDPTGTDIGTRPAPTLDQFGAALNATQPAGSPIGQGAQAGGGALWTVQGPDGSTKQLPPTLAQQFIAKGAKRVA